MKKLFTNLNSLLVATALLFTSCSYDDTGLWDELNGVKGEVADLTERVAELEEKLGTEVAALKAMIEAQVVVSGYEKDENSGDITVTLSDGKKFTVYAESENSAVTVVTENGVQYWAVVDANDTAVPVLDAEGNKIPVVPVKEEPVLPQFAKSEDGSKVVVSFDGGLTWSETGAATTEALDKVSLFSGVEIVEVESVYGVKVALQAVVTLADGNKFTIDLDPAYSVEYYQTFGTQFEIKDAYSGQVVKNLYVPVGGEESLQTVSGNIVDFLVEKPAGWKVVFEDMRREGDTEAYWIGNVKAPSAAAIEAGVAEAEGDVKVLAVTAGGKVIPASLFVSTNAVKNITMASGNIDVVMNASTMTYLYGLAPYAGFSADAIKEAAVTYPYTYQWDPTLGVVSFGGGDLTTTIVDMLGKEQDQSYVFWLATMGEDENWNLFVQDFYTVTAPYLAVSVTEATTTGANVSVKIDTTDKFYAAVFQPGYYGQTVEEQLENNLGNLCEYYPEKYNTTLPYEGAITDLALFAKTTMVPGTTYAFCVLPYDAEKIANNGYTVSDAKLVEFTTALPSVKDATLAEVTISEVAEGASKVSAKITKVTGKNYYYAFVSDEVLAGLADEAAKVAYLLANGKPYAYTGTQSYTMGEGETSTNLLVVPFTADWTYGEVVSQKLTVKPIVYNDIVVSIDKVKLTGGTHTADTANPYFGGYTVTFSATGGTAKDYLVYMADTSSNYPYIQYFGNSVDGVVPYLVDNATQMYLKSTSGATTYTFETKIKKYLEEYYTPTTNPLEYKLIVVAVDEAGNYSKPASKSIYYKDFPVPAAQ